MPLTLLQTPRIQKAIYTSAEGIRMMKVKSLELRYYLERCSLVFGPILVKTQKHNWHRSHSIFLKLFFSSFTNSRDLTFSK